MMDIMNNQFLHFDSYNWKLDVLWWKEKFEDVRFSWINRDANRVVDKLAKQRILNDKSCMFYHYVPYMIIHELHNDYVDS